MDESGNQYSRLELLLSRFVKVKPGEGKSVALHFVSLFIVMLAYYLLKVIRDPLILGESTAEMKGYLTAAQAALLLIITPLFSKFYVRFSTYSDRSRFIRSVIWFAVTNLLLFVLLLQIGVSIGTMFYVWLGVFSVVVIALYWAFCADCYSAEAGNRLFILIAVGGALGAWIGSNLAGWSYPYLGVIGIFLMATVLLVIASLLVSHCYRCVPSFSMADREKVEPAKAQWHKTLFKIFQKRYLLLIAVFIVLINFIHSMGEYVLASFVEEIADNVSDGNADARGAYMAQFYSSYNAWSSFLGLLLQIFLVAKIFKWVGVGASILILPVVMMFNYTLVLFFPIFSVLRWTLVAEKSVNYSIQNTTRHALFLPIPRADKYIGKNVIEGFFYRFGDVLYGGVLFLGITVFDADKVSFIMLNALLAFVCCCVAFRIRLRYRKLEAKYYSAHSKPPVDTRSVN